MHKHGMSKTKIYKLWTGMHQRCSNPNTPHYKNYGGRGITVCHEWNSFEKFYADMGERPTGKTLDRKDNEKGYSKENCRWASSNEQLLNKRPRGTNKNNSTGIPGVYWKPSHNKFVARKTVNGKRVYLGFFSTMEQAKAALL